MYCKRRCLFSKKSVELERREEKQLIDYTKKKGIVKQTEKDKCSTQYRYVFL
jgi:hypothetical protein